MAERINVSNNSRKHAPDNQDAGIYAGQYWLADAGLVCPSFIESVAPTRARRVLDLGDVVVRIADELEPEALDRVRIISLDLCDEGSV